MHSDIQIDIEIAPRISIVQSTLNELKEQLPKGSEEKKTVKELEQSIGEVKQTKSPEEAAKSPAMSKFRRFIQDLGDEKSSLGKAVKGIKNGVRIGQELAGYYNDIAQWCGLPQVPKPFLKK